MKAKTAYIQKPKYPYNSGLYQARSKFVTKSKNGKKAKPKDSQLVIRINRAERDRFVDACMEMDTSAAREIRRFIRDFVKENYQE